MKYREKEYKNFIVIFENNEPTGVILLPEMHKYSHCLSLSGDSSVTTYWNNELLTNKPIIN